MTYRWQWLDKCYPDSAPTRQVVGKWFADFKRGHTNTDDAERTGCPNSTVPENIRKIYDNGLRIL